MICLCDNPSNEQAHRVPLPTSAEAKNDSEVLTIIPEGPLIRGRASNRAYIMDNTHGVSEQIYEYLIDQNGVIVYGQQCGRSAFEWKRVLEQEVE